MSTLLDELIGQAGEFGLGQQDVFDVAGTGTGGVAGLLAELGFSTTAEGLAEQLGIPSGQVEQFLPQINQLLASAGTALGDIPGRAQELLGQAFSERRTAGETALAGRDIRIGEATRGFAGGQRALQANALQQAEAIRTRGAASGFAGAGVSGQAARRGRFAGTEAAQDLFGGLTSQIGAAQSQFGSTIAGLQTGLLGQIGGIGRQREGEREDVLGLLGSGLTNLLNTLVSTGVSEGLRDPTTPSFPTTPETPPVGNIGGSGGTPSTTPTGLAGLTDFSTLNFGAPADTEVTDFSNLGFL